MSNSHIGASIEVSAKHVHDGKLHAEQLPKGTRVYITDVGVDPVADLISAARKVTDMGYQTVPHIPARRIESTDALESRLAGMVNEGGVQDILIIAGEADEQMARCLRGGHEPAAMQGSSRRWGTFQVGERGRRAVALRIKDMVLKSS